MKTPMPHVDPSFFSPAAYHGPPAVPGVCWHYTTSHKCRKIVEHGALEPFPHLPGAAPLLWASLNHVWEPSVCRAAPLLTWEHDGVPVPKVLTFAGMQAFGVRLCRIALALADVPLTWDDACTRAKMRRSHKTHLDRSGRGLGAHPDDWRATTEPVPQEDWRSVEIWNGTQCCWEVVWQP